MLRMCMCMGVWVSGERHLSRDIEEDAVVDRQMLLELLGTGIRRPISTLSQPPAPTPKPQHPLAAIGTNLGLWLGAREAVEEDVGAGAEALHLTPETVTWCRHPRPFSC